ncbi:thioredoxin family protein [Porticoccus sp. W117]|uniref:thioredoxin family protein n=1 Tax=Porticoccus sp. W117 TaxID=3054777 RepID=UPI002599D1FB|nr:thioredoxin family protein [Porticoccus sp. W117]MDM3870812.1 thioredoxin family protein [Porticoccus sp. W117]
MKAVRIALASALFTFASGVAIADEGIAWHTDYQAAAEEAKASGKLLFINFSAQWCGPCQAMKRDTYPNLAVKKQMERFVPVYIDVDNNTELANKFGGNARAYGGNGIPAMIVVDNDGNELYRHHGYRSAAQLTAALGKIKTGDKQ